MYADEVRFGGLPIQFDDRVLRPRPWTSIQSEWAIELCASLPDGPILELCAGVGHIGLVAAARTGRELVQVEDDPTAAGFARANAAHAGVTADVREADLASAVAVGESFPLIIADPPYIPSGETDSFGDDPPPAIDGGPDGLDVIRTCMQVAARHLDPNGALLMQTRGVGQARAVAQEHGTDLRLCDVRAYDHERAVALFMKVGD
jgi:release factor glutamine methyltransferase